LSGAEARLCLLDNPAEGRLVLHGEVGKHLASISIAAFFRPAMKRL